MSLLTADEVAREHRTELFIGVVAPVGVRVDTFITRLERTLDVRFGYRTKRWRLSKLIGDFADAEVNNADERTRLTTAMDAGNTLRESVGEDCLARAAMNAIAQDREVDNSEEPTAHVFWSLKHPEEVATLRLVYGRGFHLVGLLAPEEELISELSNRTGIDEKLAKDLISRDTNERGAPHGQQTRDTFQLADVFLRWGKDQDEDGLKRFLDLVYGSPCQSPSLDEHAMYLAFANAMRSGELSRQVGATMVSPHGDVIALGANDVPRRGGGLYWPGEDDRRDHQKGFDSNTKRRDELMEAVARTIGGSSEERTAEVRAALRTTPLKDLTEYGRSVHAEMDAISTCARTGQSARDATLFVTTFPCHNCARHIIASGVARVVFVEPYAKSRAELLHEDDIKVGGPADPGPSPRVLFEHHRGIGPRRYVDYFSMNLSDGYTMIRKGKSGDLVQWNPREAAPRTALPEYGYKQIERVMGSELVDYFKKEEEVLDVEEAESDARHDV